MAKAQRHHPRSGTYQYLSKISEKKYQIEVDVDWRYDHLFEYLQISPSYRLARLIANGKLKKDPSKLPSDFALVEATYQRLGDVHRTYFQEWWINRAQFQFGASASPKPKLLLNIGQGVTAGLSSVARLTQGLDKYLSTDRPVQGMPGVLVVALPATADRRKLLRELDEMLATAVPPEPTEARPHAMALEQNKIREATLQMALRVLRARASYPDEKLYQTGNRTKVSPALWTDPARARKDGQDDKRRTMEIMTSRQLWRAYVLAENAARGRFPSLEPLKDDPNRPEFDYAVLLKDYSRYVEWGWKRIAELKEERRLAAVRKAGRAEGAAPASDPVTDVSEPPP